MLRLFVCFLCVALSLPLLAQQRLEIIALKYRLPDQVLPALQAFLEPGGTLSGMNGKIFVRASPGNIQELRRVLDTLDTRPRSLMIFVRQGGSTTLEEREAGLDGGLILHNGDLNVTARGQMADVKARSSEQIVQRIQTVEDGTAWIYLGKSLPMRMIQRVSGPGGSVATLGTQYVDVGSGFAVRPQLSGDQVQLQISPQQLSVGRGGVIEGSSLSTTIRGRLGEWLPLGGGSVQGEHGARGLLSHEQGSREQSSEYWIKAEAMD